MKPPQVSCEVEEQDNREPRYLGFNQDSNTTRCGVYKSSFWKPMEDRLEGKRTEERIAEVKRGRGGTTVQDRGEKNPN